jgi:hypothetical protein
VLGAIAAFGAGTAVVLAGFVALTIGSAILFEGAGPGDAMEMALVTLLTFPVLASVAGGCVAIPLLAAGLPGAWLLRRAGHATRAKLALLGGLVGLVGAVLPPGRGVDEPVYLGLAALSGAVSGFVLCIVAWPATPSPSGCERGSDR